MYLFCVGLCRNYIIKNIANSLKNTLKKTDYYFTNAMMHKCYMLSYPTVKNYIDS